MSLVRCAGTIAVVAALSACVAGQQPPTGANDADRLGVLINDARRQLGLPALERSASLDADARALAASLAARQRLRHRSTKEFHSLSVDWIRVAENVGTGANADEVHRLLMSSPPHRANVLGPYTLVGIGVSRDRRDRLWVTEVFVAR